MSLTAAETNAIKRYLGYDLITADGWRGDGAAGLDRNLGHLNADAETAVRAVLTELAAVDTLITTARESLTASAVGNLKLDAHREIGTLRKERGALSAELARLLGVTPPNGAGQVIV